MAQNWLGTWLGSWVGRWLGSLAGGGPSIPKPSCFFKGCSTVHRYFVGYSTVKRVFRIGGRNG